MILDFDTKKGLCRDKSALTRDASGIQRLRPLFVMTGFVNVGRILEKTGEFNTLLGFLSGETGCFPTVLLKRREVGFCWRD